MNQQIVSDQITLWLEPGRKKFTRMISRSSRIRFVLLSLTNISGVILMLSPLLTLAAASGGAVYLYNHVQGPLDWFIVEVLGAVSLFSGYLTIQFCFSRPEAPLGVPIGHKHAPELFSMLERRIAHFRIRPINSLTLTPDVELKIKATPKWPVPLIHTYSLCIGAPLLFFMSPGQFRLALAGAIAATAQKRHSWSGWLVQASEDWPVIVATLEQRTSLLTKVLLKPAAWIGRAAHTLSMELRTDSRQTQSRWVLENTDEQAAVEYLSNQVIAGTFLNNQYWPMIYKAAERCPAPVVKPFAHFGLLLERLLNEDSARRWLLQAQSHGGGNGQPDLRDLLAESGIDNLHWSQPPEINAFQNLFTSTDILKSLDTLWQAVVEPEWNQRHTSFQNDRLRFEKLQTRAGQQVLRGDSALRYVKLAGKFMDREKAVAVYRDMYRANLDDASLCFNSGYEMLKSGQLREGYEALQRAAELDSSLANRAHAMINEHRHAWIHEDDEVAKQACQ
ncbi:MAG: hypothetical protein BMS9Abin09_0933 [Gammaproteobacteria bacterium]|nr:MAG: hypothetical protein BMS9Abin09_0933 [Gammaproteobacteria bacterium]